MLIRAAFALVVVGSIASSSARPQAPSLSDAACSGLATVTLAASVIGLPTSGASVSSAEIVDDQTGRFCKVLGAIRPVDPAAPPINFRVNLPVSWNEKAVHLGGGGFDGTVPAGVRAVFPDPAAPPILRQGYVTFASDSGHATAPGQDAAAFALNDEALANFAGDQLKKTHDAALEIVRKAYGRPPRRVYFMGASQGGHEALTVLQRYPKDYDGAVAVHPVYDLTALHLDGVLLGQALYNPPGAWVPPDKVARVTAAVLAACDPLDGVADGVIGNVPACRKAFDIASLQCAAADGADCLTAAQVATFRTFASPVKLGVTLAGGVDTFAPWPVLEGGSMARSFGQAPDRPAPGRMTTAAFMYVMGDQTTRYLLLRDPSADSLQFDVAQHAAALQALSRRLDASDPDLSAFRQRGGKLLLMHGTVDMAVTPHNTTAYYDRLKVRFGDQLETFVRYYVAPGFGHGDGNFVVGWDSLGTLDAWVDRGTPPGPQVVTDTNRATAGRTRPLCEYPLYPKYNGSGDVSAAASFTCTRP